VSKKNRTQAAQVAATQQPEAVASWLQPYAQELTLLERYLNGETAIAEQVREAFAAKLAENGGRHKGPIDGNLNTLVVVHGMPSDILTVVYGDGKEGEFKRERAEQAIACAKEAGTAMRSWGKEEAQRVIEAWQAKNPAAAQATGRTSILAMLSAGGGNPAQRRFPLFYGFAYAERRDHGAGAKGGEVLTKAMKVARLETKIAEAEAKRDAAAAKRDYVAAEGFAQQAAGLQAELEALNSKTDEVEEVIPETPANEPTLEDQISEVEARESKAVEAKNYAAAGEAAAELAELRQQLEAQAAPAATTPAPVAPAANKPTNSSDTLSLPQAIAACKNGGNNRLKKVFGRYKNDDNFGDDEFVATVQALL